MRYFAIIDGASVNDIAENEPGEVSGETYNYYLFLRAGGEGVIMRETTDGFEYRFHMFGYGDINTIWAARQAKDYKRSSAFKKL
jgi:hypothetical protein